MARALIANNAETTLSAAITSTGATTFAVVSAASFPIPTAGQYFYVRLLDANLIPENVKVTGVSGLTFTCVRGQDGTTARTFAAGASVELTVSAAVMAELATIESVVEATSGNPIHLNPRRVVVDTTIPGDANASSAGPMMIMDGVTVTVADNATWSIH